MPYILKTYATGAQLSVTNNNPQDTGNFEAFAQAGWNPAAQGLNLVVGAIYRMDGPDGVNRQIKIKSVGAGLNSITYERDGIA
ncbi:hypothetical protein POL68_26835 [Stigmatella sp. ncwal1]|uniref:Uncharacterized protein n=1 Tax=Stigmatella ashevillensis TaxID=2995309 RepID=A0ABT5DIF2_9BACT|nr:hypothetical protein [Stigmatella ashevillena]MDC0712111.1 hypothetical protein [Stigmatella ashevillena]